MMPALLVAPAAETTTNIPAEPPFAVHHLPMSATAEDPASTPTPIGSRTRSGRHPLAIVIGLVVLSTVLLLALAVVALTDGTDRPTTESEPTTGPGQARR